MSTFKTYLGGPAERIPRPRRPDDPEDLDPIAPGSCEDCRGCHIYHEIFYRPDGGRAPCDSLPCRGHGGENAPAKCRAELRPDGRKVVFVPKFIYGNEEEG